MSIIGKSGSKLPHSLRIVILFLRLALGLDFFYLAFSVLFNPSLGQQLHARSLNGFYAWLATSGTAAVGGDWIHPFAQWAFLIIGACLIIGLATRFTSIVAIILTLLSFLPNISYYAISVAQFINDEVIVIICLLILVFSDAGSYFGVDKFIHVSLKNNKE
jgi:uncharacterized membrane protein YphA (DoxX/SURF4 family)